MGQSTTKEEAIYLLQNDILLDSSIVRHIGQTNRSNVNHFGAVVGSSWLQTLALQGSLIVDEVFEKWRQNQDMVHAVLQPTYICRGDDIYTKVRITVLRKPVSFKLRLSENVALSNSSLFDFLEDVAAKEKQHFHQNLSKFSQSTWNDGDSIGSFDLDDFACLLAEFYDNISIVYLNRRSNINHNGFQTRSKSHHPHFFPVISVLESSAALYVIEPESYHTLADCLQYSPAILGKSFANLKFLFYQLLNIFTSLKKYNLPISRDLTLADFHLFHDSLWLSISPLECINPLTNSDCLATQESIVKIYKGRDTNLLAPLMFTEPLSVYTSEWCKGNISNFDYIFIINVLSGRKFGDPLNHPVFPWVTDFSCKYGGARDLTKSKFRLAKGDRQLDATFNAGIGTNHQSLPIQHHVSDVLSDITYYIYHARTTSRDVLCSHVRSRWVPDEYPSTLERMYAWTPDECIPEFFFDPSIFKSSHEDLPDLCLPQWIGSANEFVEYHYRFLESHYVSRYLHNWIDLVFGCKLSGAAAKNEKNVHLSLVDDHIELKNFGVMQLFKSPHPERVVPNELDEFSSNVEGRDVRSRSNSWEYVDFTASMMKGRIDTLSEALIDMDESLLAKKAKTFYDGAIGNTTGSAVEEDIGMPNDYQISELKDVDFLDDLIKTEKMLLHELSVHPVTDKSIGKYGFGSVFQKEQSAKYATLDDDVKIFVCLLIEIVLEKELRMRTFVPGVDERFRENIALLESSHHIPCWVKMSILDTLNCCHDTFGNSSEEAVPKYCTLNSYMNGFHFPPYFQKLHEFLNAIYGAVECFKHGVMSGDKEKLSTNIQAYGQLLSWLLDELDREGAEMLLLYLSALFKYKNVQIPLFLHIFPSLCLVLGPMKSQVVFIRDLQMMYDSIKTTEEILLLQKTFLSQALSSFGLDCFLNIFMGAVLEVLTAHQIETNPLTKGYEMYPQVSKDLQMQQDLLINYQVPQDFEGALSLNSYHLDDFFREGSSNDNSSQKLLLTLSKEYTSNISDDLNDTLVADGTDKKNSASPSPLQSPEKGKYGDVLFSSSLSSEEASSLSGSLAISSEAKTISDDSNILSNADMLDCLESKSDIICPSHKHEIDSFSDNVDSKTCVLSNDKDSGHSVEKANVDITENASLEEGVERIPCDDELIFEKTASNIDYLPTAGVCQTIVESVTWLIPWLGPTVSTEFVALPLLKNLFKVLLSPEGEATALKAIDILIEKVSPTIECLIEMALVYGDNIVFHLYLPTVSKFITAASATTSSVSVLVGSKLITSMQLLLESCRLLHIRTISDYMEKFSVDIAQPLIRLLSSMKRFASGVVIKRFLLRRLIDILGILSHKLSREVAQDLMAPLLQQFFSCFDGIYSVQKNIEGVAYVKRKYNLLYAKFEMASVSATDEDHQALDKIESASGKQDSRITTKSIDEVLAEDSSDEQFSEIYETFSPSAAYHAYVLFCRVLGNIYIEKTLYNSDLIVQLCAKHDEYQNQPERSGKEEDVKWLQPISSEDDRQFANRSSWQHLTGNWLDHWQENLTKGSSKPLYFSDRKLQAYAGHSSVIRDFYIPDNEHFFLSASRDKTVKFWLLKNHGNGTAYLGCTHTYSEHTKPVFAVQGMESKRVVASCDGTVHIWDQVTGSTVCRFDAGPGHTITSIRTLPAPSTCCAVATTDGQMRIYDIRQHAFAQSWKISPQTNTGMVRCMCVNNVGTWIAAGFSSGIVSVIDLHTGSLRGQTRVHDGEITQMQPVPGYGFISSAVDSNLRVWNEDGSVSHILKTSSEYVHSVAYCRQQLLWATANNKVTIHNKEKMSTFETFKISNEQFKGNLSKMAVLPISQLYLLGVDSGGVALYG